MIGLVNQILEKINEAMSVDFKFKARQPSRWFAEEFGGRGEVVIESDLNGPLYISCDEHATGRRYVLFNEGGNELLNTPSLVSCVAEACRISFSDWLESLPFRGHET